MSEKPKTLDVSIMGRSYRVTCAEEEREALLAAVAYVDKKMTEIKAASKVTGTERIAVMAALNMANELLRSRSRGEHLEGDAKLRLQAMRERVEGALQTTRQLEL